MAKRVFFSFHYDDVKDFRANVVRNHWVMKPGREISGYYDASIWESARKQGSIALKRLINNGLDQTSNTCVLIGSETFARPWVRYELLKSFKKGNHIFGVHINSIRSKDRTTKPLGPNPLEYLGVSFSGNGKTATLWEKTSGGWKKYEEIDGTSSHAVEVSREFHGKGFNLGHFCETYDWIDDDGYDNFSDWVG
jgi:hypothetical protein